MKIGIVTYHRTNNYGAVMQALATRFVLEDMGHEAYYVDYWPKYHREKYEIFPKEKFRKFDILHKAKFLFILSLYYKSKKKRIENFDEFFQHHIFPYCRSVDDSFDVVIYGSDQIWRKQKETEGYNPFYFGENNIKTQHHISYAASMGILPNNDTDKAKVNELVSHLERISVREISLRNLLLSLGNKNVSLSLDPTLLLSSNEWDKHLPTEMYTGTNYVLVYIMGANSFDLNEIKKFAENRELKMIVLRGYATTKETETNITTAGPSEFVRLIKNADYVFSASFHGVAFSIIFGKQFFTSFKSNSERASSLLNQLGLTDRLLPPNSKIPQNRPDIDYGEVNKKLQVIRNESWKYLEEIIN